MALLQDDYYHQLKSLKPSGLAWPDDDEAVQNQLLAGLAFELARIDARIDDLLNELDPRDTLELLASWERVCGLPDTCTGLATTIQQRRNAVVSKLTNIGGQSPQYFINLAASLGFVITITEFHPFRAGISATGDPLYDAGSSSVWQVNAPATTITWFRAGVSAAGEPLAVWGNDLLECVIKQHKPAHPAVIFAYGDAAQESADEAILTVL